MFGPVLSHPRPPEALLKRLLIYNAKHTSYLTKQINIRLHLCVCVCLGVHPLACL